MSLKTERFKASVPFLILTAMVFWFAAKLIQTTRTVEGSLAFLRTCNSRLTEGTSLHGSWEEISSALTEGSNPGRPPQELLQALLPRTSEWLGQIRREPAFLKEMAPSLDALEKEMKSFRYLEDSPVAAWPREKIMRIPEVPTEVMEILMEIQQIETGKVQQVNASALPSVPLTFFMALATILVILLLQNLFAEKIRKHLLALREILLDLNQDRFNPDRELKMNLNGWAGGLYPLPKIAYLINCFLDRHNEMLRKIALSADNCESATRLIRNCHKEIYEGTRVQASASDDTSSSIFEMSATLREITNNVQSLSHSSDESSTSIQAMDHSIQQITQQSDEHFSMIEESSASIHKMIASIGESRDNLNALSLSIETSTSSVAEMNASIKAVEGLAKESAALSQKSTMETSEFGVKAVEKTIKGMERIRKSVEETDRMVEVLHKRSEKIGQILNVIDEVAEKTNLLALNAAIIASKAGEHGKGFSVVADEIKALSDRTASSIDQIEEVISDVQSETDAIAQGIHLSVQEVQKGVENSRETKEALGKILQQSQRSSEMSWEIEKAAIEQVKSIGHIDTEIQNINGRAKQITAAVEEQDKGGEIIREMVEKLRRFAQGLKKTMADESMGSRRVAHEIENMILKIQEINRSIHEQGKGSELIVSSIERIRNITEDTINMTDDLSTAINSLSLYNEELQKEVHHTTHNVEAKGLTLGVIPLESGVKMEIRFTPLARYLEQQLNQPVKIAVAEDFKTALNDFGAGKYDLAYLTPSTYVEAKKRYGARIILKAIRNHMPFYHSVIAVRKGSNIHSIADLKGKRFAFGDEHSTSSYLIPRSVLARDNIHLSDLAAYEFKGHHDDVAWAVINGEVEAGGLLEPIARNFEAKGLEILATSDEIPEFNLCVRKEIAPELERKLTQALLSLNETVESDRNILQTIEPQYNGFMTATESDYAGVAAMMTFMEQDVA